MSYDKVVCVIVPATCVTSDVQTKHRVHLCHHPSAATDSAASPTTRGSGAICVPALHDCVNKPRHCARGCL